jgi:hypothetical protein
MRALTSEQIHQAMKAALAEVDRQLAAGTLDQSGRFWTDEELAAGAATGAHRKPEDQSKASAA